MKLGVFIFPDAPVKQWDETPKNSTSWNGSNDNRVLDSLLSKKSKGIAHAGRVNEIKASLSHPVTLQTFLLFPIG